ncbi:MAG: class I SAM-dependent methyltransferase [Deltaproteobacteria bacterium]|nr:class I SAM-dependent methyltransferase [Deltaproteobacteria bacterium]
MTDLKSRLRPVYASVFERSPTARILYLLATPRTRRNTEFVRDGYMGSWAAYQARLDASHTLEDWLCIRGFDDAPTTHVRDGRVIHGGFDTNRYWIDEIEQTIREHFPTARSITEYGCGVGRNLLALKRRFPEMACYGYELADAGVEVARNAAKKFGLDVKYSQLDYVKDGDAKYVHPKTDLALTVFSLEQIPHVSPVAVKNMLDHATLGTIHVEPVCENYPKSYLGMLGRVYSKRVDFLQNFDFGVRALPVRAVHAKVLDTSHNPLIPNPSVYSLVK